MSEIAPNTGEGNAPDLSALLGMLGGIAGGGEEKPPPPPGPAPEAAGGLPFDPALLSTLSRAMKALREPDRNIQLLQALRPFLEPERQKKVDEAVKNDIAVAQRLGITATTLDGILKIRSQGENQVEP